MLPRIVPGHHMFSVTMSLAQAAGSAPSSDQTSLRVAVGLAVVVAILLVVFWLRQRALPTQPSGDKAAPVLPSRATTDAPETTATTPATATKQAPTGRDELRAGLAKTRSALEGAGAVGDEQARQIDVDRAGVLAGAAQGRGPR